MSQLEAYGVECARLALYQETATTITKVSVIQLDYRVMLTGLGFERGHTDEFETIRRRTVDKQYLEVGRLEKRLSKLTQLLANPPLEDSGGGGSMLWPLGGAKSQQRALEQSVISWEDDASVPKCPFCQQEFTNYTFRRHHCRTCGRVVCGDPRTDCSANVGLNVAAREFSPLICFQS
jgi:hypothetical protein